VRVFEYEISKFNSTVSAADASDLIRKIGSNYGSAGAVYADFISRNKDSAEKVVRAVRDQLAACKFEAKDRFWEVTMVTLIAGAHLANACGLASFDVPAIQAHLINALKELRTSTMTKATYDYNAPDYGELALSEMISDIRGRHLLVTDIVPGAMGRPPTVSVQPGYHTDRLQAVWMQMGMKDGRIVASIKAFNQWLVEHDHQPKKVRQLLDNDYRIAERKVQIGVGVQGFDTMHRTNCYDMTPRVSRIPSSPSSSSGSPAPTTPAS
jgi:hypothetical protein